MDVDQIREVYSEYYMYNRWKFRFGWTSIILMVRIGKNGLFIILSLCTFLNRMHFYASRYLIPQTTLMACDSFSRAARATCRVSSDDANAYYWWLVVGALSRRDYPVVMQWTQRDVVRCWSLICETWVPSFRTSAWLMDDSWKSLSGVWMKRTTLNRVSQNSMRKNIEG